MNETPLPLGSSEPNAPTLLVLDSNLDGLMECVAVGIEDTADFVAWDPTTSGGAYSLSGSAIMNGKEITFGVYLFIDAESGDTLLQARHTSGDKQDFFKVWDGVRAELVANARKVRQYVPSTVSRETSTGNEPSWYSNRGPPSSGGSFDDPDLEQAIAIYGLARTLHPPSADVPVSHIRTNDDPPSISTGFIRYYYATYDTESPNDANYFVHDDLYYTPARSPVLIIRLESPLELYRDGSFVGQTSTSSNAGVVQRLRLAADQFVVHTSRAVQDADLRAQEASMEDDIVVSSKRMKLIRAVYYPFESQLVTPRFLGDGVGAHTPLGDQPDSTSDLFPLTQDSSGSSSPTSTTANTETTTTASYPFLRVEYYLDNDTQRFQDDVLYMFPVPFFHPRPLFKQGRWCESTQADNMRALQRLQSFVIQAVDDIRAREGRDIRLASATYYNKTWGRTELNRKIPIATPTDDDPSRYTVQLPPVPYATQQDPSISDDVEHDEPSHTRFRRQVIDRLRPLLRNYISESTTPTQREEVKQNTLDKMHEVINTAYHEQANGPDERLDEAYMALQDLLLLKKSKPSSMTRKRAAAQGGDSSAPSSEQPNDIAERLVTPLVQHCDRADAAQLMNRLVRTVQFCDQTTDIRRLLCDIRQILHEQGGGNTQGTNLPPSLHQEIQQFFDHTFHKDHTMVSCTVVLHNLRNLHQQLAASQVTL